MDIYLVRVRTREDGTLFIERKDNATTNDEFIAVSHVWGSPETIQPTHVDGAGIVELSPGKKDILSILRRNDVCGESWFWMDLFCLDQTEGATISISEQLQSIPYVYKASQRVKVLIESPICQAWQDKVLSVAIDPTNEKDRKAFLLEELGHSRKCPNLLIFDPWFDRLWTRSEGLYGTRFDIVILNPVPCQRNGTLLPINTRRLAEGKALQRRTAVETFLMDKLAYNGVDHTKSSKEVIFELYMDLVYWHHLRIDKYGGKVGPAPNYSPFKMAWRSGRVTAKPRDYTIAVFLDISGYKAPPNAKRMPFSELITDALGQTPVRKRFYVSPKVPNGMMTVTTPKESVTPWVLHEPMNVGDAYDTFVVHKLADSQETAGWNVYTVPNNFVIEELDINRSNMSKVLNIWFETADSVRHVEFSSHSGPCTGLMKGDLWTEQGLLMEYFFFQFGRRIAKQYLLGNKVKQASIPAWTIPLDRVTGVSCDVFNNELRRFLACLLCGTSLRIADIILERADFRIVSTACGKLLALINREVISRAKDENFVLTYTPTTNIHGFMLGLRTSAGVVIVGRTVIPRTGLLRRLVTG